LNRIPPVLFFVHQPIDLVADPATHGFEIHARTGSSTRPSPRSRASNTIHQLAAGFKPLIQSPITNILTALPLTALPLNALPRLKTSIHLLTLTTTLLQPTLPLPTDQCNRHPASF
jgi:hypothetical protein